MKNSETIREKFGETPEDIGLCQDFSTGLQLLKKQKTVGQWVIMKFSIQ